MGRAKGRKGVSDENKGIPCSALVVQARRFLRLLSNIEKTHARLVCDLFVCGRRTKQKCSGFQIWKFNAMSDDSSMGFVLFVFVCLGVAVKNEDDEWW